MTYSIIIPTYNSGRTIKRCLESVIGQTYTDYEILIMDGSSEDETLTIVGSFNDGRIHVFSAHDAGVYDAMNKGIERSIGEWVYFLGSDDWLLDAEVLERVSVYLDKSYHVVYGDCESNHLSKGHYGAWTLDTLQYNRCQQGIFYNRCFWETGIRFNLKYKVLADFDVNLKWFLDLSHFRYKYIPIKVAYFSDGGISSKFSDSIFYNDYCEKLLCYGRESLPAKHKKRALRRLLSRRTSGFWKQSYYWFWVVCYHCIQKVQEARGVAQDELRVCQIEGNTHFTPQSERI